MRDYIHENPVTACFVSDAIDWKYNSPHNYQGGYTVLEIDSDGFLLGLVK